MKPDTKHFLVGLSSYIGEFIGAIIKGFKAGFKEADK